MFATVEKSNSSRAVFIVQTCIDPIRMQMARISVIRTFPPNFNEHIYKESTIGEMWKVVLLVVKWPLGRGKTFGIAHSERPEREAHSKRSLYDSPQNWYSCELKLADSLIEIGPPEFSRGTGALKKRSFCPCKWFSRHV